MTSTACHHTRFAALPFGFPLFEPFRARQIVLARLVNTLHLSIQACASVARFLPNLAILVLMAQMSAFECRFLDVVSLHFVIQLEALCQLTVGLFVANDCGILKSKVQNGFSSWSNCVQPCIYSECTDPPRLHHLACRPCPETSKNSPIPNDFSQHVL